MPAILITCAVALTSAAAAAAPSRPNLVLILCDDVGYGDLACYGNAKIKTPHVDRLAAGGVRFTDFYAAGAQCTPSRAGLLTGRYPVRVGLTYALMAGAGAGIPQAETLLPEALQKLGYATALCGKWHLGDQPRFHPLDHGFDHFSGLLRGHDTEPREFYRDRQIVDPRADPNALTARYTQAAVAFIGEQAEKKQPFFLMLAHTSPHIPLSPGAAFRGRSAGGAYGDVVEEVDDSVGQIFAALKTHGLDGDTLVVVTSDNGPELGSTGGLRGGKFSVYEGGVRVPAIFWMPAKFKPRTESRPAILLDLFPTFLSLAGGKPPPGRAIDGKNLLPLLTDGKPRDGDEFFFYSGAQPQACRVGPWKLKTNPPELFDLSKDPTETTNLAPTHPEIVARLQSRLTTAPR